MNDQIQTKTKNIILTIVGVIAMMVFASEMEKPEYWWIQAIAAVIIFIIIKVTLGGKNGRNS